MICGGPGTVLATEEPGKLFFRSPETIWQPGNPLRNRFRNTESFVGTRDLRKLLREPKNPCRNLLANWNFFFEGTRGTFRNLFWNTVLHCVIELKLCVLGLAGNATLKLMRTQLEALVQLSAGKEEGAVEIKSMAW